MNSKERVKRAINFQNPDRLPISHAVLPAAQLRYGDRLNEILSNIHEDFGWDLLPDTKPQDFPPMYREGENPDEMGTVWHVKVEGMCGIPVGFPLDRWEDYSHFQWPEFSAGPPSARLYSGHITRRQGDYYARGGWITFFEQMQQLRGMENLLMDLALKTKEIYRLRDDLLDFNLRWIDKWLKYEYDGLHFADDWGTQNSLMVSPEFWRLFFKPVYKEMFSRVISAGLDVHFHSDGQIIDIIPDLLDLGVKVLNCECPVIGLEHLKRHFAGKVAFRTDLDRQKILSFGTPNQVKQHVFDVFKAVGTPEGGVIACGEIGPDVPLENIEAMYEAFIGFRW